MTKIESIKVRLLENRLTVAWLHYRLTCLGYKISLSDLKDFLNGQRRFTNQSLIVLDCVFILNVYDRFVGKNPLLNDAEI